ncbi:MAG: HAD family hydrolase [Candidatus Omnitrophica bacterium]|nr:HAD family hydrolase [Candidatus Omnitrophota bacterium]
MMTPEEKVTAVSRAVALRKAGQPAEAFKALAAIADKADDAVLQARYARVLASLDEAALAGLAPLRVAILSSTTESFIRDILKFWLAMAGFRAVFFDAAYDSIAPTVLDPGSTLYAFDPDIIWIFTTFRDIRIPSGLERPRDLTARAIDDAVGGFSALWEVIRQRSRAYIIQNNADLPAYRSLGNYAGVAPWSSHQVLRQYNLRLAEAVTEGVTIFDLDFISSVVGKDRWLELAHWYNSKIPFNLDAAGEVAYQASRLIAAVKGRARKCLVLDLDNTLWGGVIGDDGIEGIALGDGSVGEAFVDFQKYILELKNRGVILAVCSKNDEAKAREPFLKHPDMVLKIDDISVFVANWQNKADNIKEIARRLNIGLEALVFVDDNPAERALVGSFLPEVAIPALPEDSSFYRQVLDQGRYFETIGVSAEDVKRTAFYRDNAARDGFRSKCLDLEGFLKGLEMEAVVGVFDDFHVPRVMQLVNKSNQFHLTTTRYTDKELKDFAADPTMLCRHFSLKDRFGDNGLIGVVILQKQGEDLVIDTWCMSCRVLSRGMEEFICQSLVDAGREMGAKRLVGVYIPTAKNKMVADLYPRLGFKPVPASREGATQWALCLDNSLQPFKTYINRV